MEYLRKRGYYTIRSYASKGIFDIIAVRPVYHPHVFHYPLLIQAKINGYIPPKEREELRRAQGSYQGWVVICYRDKGVKFRTLSGEIIKI